MSEKDELLEFAWGIIANAGEGNWEKNETAEWREAAIRWRERYHALIAPQAPND